MSCKRVSSKCERVSCHDQTNQAGELCHGVYQFLFILDKIKGEIQLLKMLKHSLLNFWFYLCLLFLAAFFVGCFLHGSLLSLYGYRSLILHQHVGFLLRYPLLLNCLSNRFLYIVIFFLSQLDIILWEVIGVEPLELVSWEIQFLQLRDGRKCQEEFAGGDEDGIGAEIVRAEIELLKGSKTWEVTRQGAEVVRSYLQEFEVRKVRELEEVPRRDLVIGKMQPIEVWEGQDWIWLVREEV